MPNLAAKRALLLAGVAYAVAMEAAYAAHAAPDHSSLELLYGVTGFCGFFGACAFVIVAIVKWFFTP